MKKTLKLILASAALISGVVNAAEVRSISREVKSEIDGEVTWTVYITCAEIDEDRAIERVGSRGKWCSEDLPSMCGRKKVTVASKVCGTHFERLQDEYRLELAQRNAAVN